MASHGGRWHTMTPGGHNGPDVTAVCRPDGVTLRFSQGGEYIEAFLGLAHCEALGLVLTDVVREAKRKPWPNVSGRADQQA